ncbi:MAG: VWA domain-containing protein [Thermoplasmata archaeon]|nr:VWA domain-containing protein [Thermoplasmata archaeon]
MTESEGLDPSGAITRRLAEFCQFVRACGLPVGVGAEIDLGRAVGLVDPLDRPSFGSACRATLAKSPEEVELLDRAFAAFWSGGTSKLPWTGAGTAMTRPSPVPPRTRPTDGPGSPQPEPPTVSIPLGRWSASAPNVGHPLTARPEKELHDLRDGARRLRRRMATLPGRRRARSHRGGVDVRDTLRRSLRYGGEFVELRRQRPSLRRGEFVVAWDVSGSMREHESQFFSLVYALASVSRRARVFAFSTELTEVTAEVRRHRYRRAAVHTSARIALADGGTRIGGSLSELFDRAATLLRDRTTLLLLSDGWDLGEPERVGRELERLARRCHAIVWVTPYAHTPGFEPRVAALRSALPHLDLLWGPEDFGPPSRARP